MKKLKKPSKKVQLSIIKLYDNFECTIIVDKNFCDEMCIRDSYCAPSSDLKTLW